MVHRNARLTALPAMIKYGVGSPAACYASSIGVHDRAAAVALAAACPYPEPTFGQFLNWLSQLTTDEIIRITDPDTARLLIRSVEHRSPRIAQAAVLSGNGTFTCPLRGFHHAGNVDHLAELPAETPLELVRDRSNKSDPNAAQVRHQGVFLGWIARDIARPLALVLDDEPAPHVYARLSTDVRAGMSQIGTSQLSDHGTVLVTIALTSR